jgi:tetratricopeptide (TPR) repeat protein
MLSMANRPKSVESARRVARAVLTAHIPESVQSKVPALPAPPRLPEPALASFNGAMVALQRHDYVDAAKGFRAILEGFPAERGLCDRSQVYLGLCERELRSAPPAPLTIEERLTAATAALNDEDEDKAEALAKAVLAESPQQDLAMYLVAAVAARRGDHDAALDWLGRALSVNPELRAQVRHDDDFSALHDRKVFQRLIEAPSEPIRGTRRARHGQ